MTHRLFVLALLGLLISSRAGAEPLPARTWYAGFGLGLGDLTRGENDAVSGTGGFTAAVRVGRALGDKLYAGVSLGTLSFDIDRNDGEDSSASQLTVDATYYLLHGGAVDVFVRGGVGAARLRLQDERAYGLGLVFGGGLERRLGSRFALGLGLDNHVAAVEGGVTAAYWDASASLSWFW